MVGKDCNAALRMGKIILDLSVPAHLPAAVFLSPISRMIDADLVGLPIQITALGSKRFKPRLLLAVSNGTLAYTGKSKSWFSSRQKSVNMVEKTCIDRRSLSWLVGRRRLWQSCIGDFDC